MSPFAIKLEEVLVEPILDLRIEVGLPSLIPVEPPMITSDLVRISLIEEYFEKGISFEDILTSIPTTNIDLVSISKDKLEALETKLKYLRRIVIRGRPERYRVEIRPAEARKIPEEFRDRFTIRLRIRRELYPELREILEKD
jgi:hypothetical protein